MDAATPAKVSELRIGPLACPALHISPANPWFGVLSTPINARSIELLPLIQDPGPRHKPPIRKAITSFSRASRRRLLWLIGEIDEKTLANALFVTLTYPRDDPATSQKQKHLDSFLKRLCRKAPDASAIWKLEYTKNNTPHFHLLILNLGFWHHSKIAQAWAEIVASSHPNHRRAGTQVQRVSSKTNASKYITKYVGKASPLPSAHTGRIWGKAGALHHAISQKKIFAISKETYVQIRRTFDKIRRAQNRKTNFRRATNLGRRQRWFLRCSSAIKLALHFQATELCFPMPP
jgi:hypothetical protein